MDHRKIKVRDLPSLNRYFAAMDLADYKLVVSPKNKSRLCFTGSGIYGNSALWPENDFAKSMLTSITYADWIDVFFIVSDSDWHYPK